MRPKRYTAGLQRPWWEGLADLILRGDIAPSHTDATDIVDVARWFIVNHAKRAEKFGWQPAHLLGKRGLARMWAPAMFSPVHVRFEHRVIVYPMVSGLVIGRLAMPDGSCALIKGEELTALRGRHLALEEIAKHAA